MHGAAKDEVKASHPGRRLIEGARLGGPGVRSGGHRALAEQRAGLSVRVQLHGRLSL